MNSSHAVIDQAGVSSQASDTSRTPVLTEDLLKRLDRPGPRYTSYPTADRFVEAFTEEQYLQALFARRTGVNSASGGAPLSIYIHIPFCESVCYYCACNKVITRHKDRAAPYLEAMIQEIDLTVSQLGHGQKVAQLHFGGGTPTFMSDAELSSLMDKLREAFVITPLSEVSIEVDPRTVDATRLKALAAMGFNRLSFGVQDFEACVQEAVHRIQSYESVEALMQTARHLGFESTNLDLIYGLPLQTPESLARTIDKVAALRPDRVALYSYAHLPQRFKPQRRIDPAQIPPPEDRVKMLAVALEKFQAAGYEYIGMDHFALPSDSLSVAKRQGRLHRNFQGYSTMPDCDLIGLGVSAIGKVGAVYSQNAKTLEEYYSALAMGRLPVVRGLALERDDILRRAVIMAIMCQGSLSYESIELAHFVEFKEYFARELQELRDLEAMDLVNIREDGFEVTDLGWYFVRGVAMVFDKYLQSEHTRERYSRII